MPSTSAFGGLYGFLKNSQKAFFSVPIQRKSKRRQKNKPEDGIIPPEICGIPGFLIINVACAAKSGEISPWGEIAQGKLGEKPGKQSCKGTCDIDKNRGKLIYTGHGKIQLQEKNTQPSHEGSEKQTKAGSKRKALCKALQKKLVKQELPQKKE